MRSKGRTKVKRGNTCKYLFNPAGCPAGGFLGGVVVKNVKGWSGEVN